MVRYRFECERRCWQQTRTKRTTADIKRKLKERGVDVEEKRR